MPSRKFDYMEKGDKRLQAEWKGRFKEFTVTLDGKNIGQAASQDELKSGVNFETPSGERLTFSLQKSGLFGAQELHGHVDGQPIMGTSADPSVKVRGARSVLWIFGGLQLVIGLGIMFFADASSDFAFLSFIWIDGLILIGFGLFSLFGGWMAITAFAGAVLYYIVGFFTLMGSGVNPSSGIFVRILVIWMMWQGIQGVRRQGELEKAKRG